MWLQEVKSESHLKTPVDKTSSYISSVPYIEILIIGGVLVRSIDSKSTQPFDRFKHFYFAYRSGLRILEHWSWELTEMDILRIDIAIYSWKIPSFTRGHTSLAVEVIPTISIQFSMTRRRDTFLKQLSGPNMLNDLTS